MTQAAPPPSAVAVVVVEAPRLPSLAGQEAFSTANYDAAALQGGARLDEVLKSTPGVSLFRRSGSDAANPTIQGLSLRAIAPSGAGRALVTLDGAPQNDPFGGWVIWTALPGEGLSSATIVRGAGAGPYGAGALTGVVALRERALGGGEGSVTLEASGRGGWRGAGAVATDHLLLVASGSRTDGYKPVRSAVAGPADTRANLRDGALAIRVQGGSEAVTWAVRVGVYQEQRDAGLAGAGSNATGASIAATVASDHWRIQAWARRSDLENTPVSVAVGRLSTTPANDQYSTPALGYGANVAWQGHRDAWSWELGADVRAAEGHVHERFRFQSGVFTRVRNAGGRSLVAGGYAEAALARPDFALTLGARLDGWRTFDGVRLEREATTGSTTIDATPPDRSGTTPTARLGVRQRLAGDTWWRAAAYSGFRPPTLNELHRPFRVGNDVTEANSALKPEALVGIETGLAGEGALRWNLSAFFNRLSDPITNVTLGAGPGSFPLAGFIPVGGVLRQRQNVGAINAVGLEGDVSAVLGRAWTLRGAFSAARTRVDGGGAAAQLTGKRPAQAPALTVTGGVDWRPVDRLRVGASLRYETKRFEDDLNQRVLAAGASLDMRVDWRLTDRGEVFIAVENVWDGDLAVARTADGIASYAPPRMLSIGFAMRR